MTSFTYSPLLDRQIRVLVLFPGNASDSLRCALKHVNISDFPSYKALSYTWGTGGKTRSITCNMVSAEIAITASLAAALAQLRDVKESTTLWIDQVCINQEDIEERSSQVPLMAEIYTNAKQVIVWLGEADTNTESAFGCIPNLVRAFSLNSKDYFPAVFPFINSPSWFALKTVFERPYFRRVWIVQEVALAADALICCGSWSTTWENLVSVGQLLEFGGIEGEEAFGVVQVIERLRQENLARSKERLVELLPISRELKSSDPRDKVYGILGLTSDASEIAFQPDYTLPVAEVYKKVTKFLVESRGTLDVLANVAFPRSITNLPTWVPDFSTSASYRANLSSELDIPIDFPFHKLHHAQYTMPRFSLDNCILHIEGHKIDTIDLLTLSLPLEPEADFNTILREWSSFATQNTTSCDRSPNTSLNDFSRTITTTPSTSEFENFNHIQAYECWLSWLRPRNYLGDGWDEPWAPKDRVGEINAKTTAFQAKVSAACLGRRMFVSRNKRLLGIGPEGMESGDWICWLRGWKTAFVLRMWDNRSHNMDCELVGECFISAMYDMDVDNAFRVRMDSKAEIFAIR